MQNSKKYAKDFPFIILEYIQLIIVYAHLDIRANVQFCRYKISLRLTKMSFVLSCSNYRNEMEEKRPDAVRSPVQELPAPFDPLRFLTFKTRITTFKMSLGWRLIQTGGTHERRRSAVRCAKWRVSPYLS